MYRLMGHSYAERYFAGRAAVYDAFADAVGEEP
jgi:hypothetical protein